MVLTGKRWSFAVVFEGSAGVSGGFWGRTWAWSLGGSLVVSSGQSKTIVGGVVAEKMRSKAGLVVVLQRGWPLISPEKGQ